MDCTFINKNTGFNYRVGALIINKNEEILMCYDKEESFYYTVGGRVQLFETSSEAVEREVFEETGLKLKAKKLSFVLEAFFENHCKETGESQNFHELSMYYSMEFRDEYEIKNMHFMDGGRKEELFWIALKDFKDLPIYPEFLKEKLLDKQEEIIHIMEKRTEEMVVSF